MVLDDINDSFAWAVFSKEVFLSYTIYYFLLFFLCLLLVKFSLFFVSIVLKTNAVLFMLLLLSCFVYLVSRIKKGENILFVLACNDTFKTKTCINDLVKVINNKLSGIIVPRSSVFSLLFYFALFIILCVLMNAVWLYAIMASPTIVSQFSKPIIKFTYILLTFIFPAFPLLCNFFDFCRENFFPGGKFIVAKNAHPFFFHFFFHEKFAPIEANDCAIALHGILEKKSINCRERAYKCSLFITFACFLFCYFLFSFTGKPSALILFFLPFFLVLFVIWSYNVIYAHLTSRQFHDFKSEVLNSL